MNELMPSAAERLNHPKHAIHQPATRAQDNQIGKVSLPHQAKMIGWVDFTFVRQTWEKLDSKPSVMA